MHKHDEIKLISMAITKVILSETRSEGDTKVILSATHSEGLSQ